MKRNFWHGLGIAVLTLVSLAYVVPTQYTVGLTNPESDTTLGKIKTHLDSFSVMRGLDLAGGTELDYKIDLTDARNQNSDDDLQNDVDINQIAESVRDSLEARVNPAGVGEVLVKRSQVDSEEHVLVQLPPTSNVQSAKASAEQDNTLEFFEEDPSLLEAIRTEIQAAIDSGKTFAQLSLENSQREDVFEEEKGTAWLSELNPPELKEKVGVNSKGKMIDVILSGQSTAQYDINEAGELNITRMPSQTLGIPFISDVSASINRTQARHILLSYTGASRAADDVPYATKEDAKAKADELLAQIKTGGDFAELAKAFSTGPTGALGGDLGIIEPGQMVGAFDEAIFGPKTTNDAGEDEYKATPKGAGLIGNVVETEFGFHIIEVLPPLKDNNVTWKQLSWDVGNAVWKETPLGGKQLENALVGFDEVGTPLVNLLFDDEGADLFGELTTRVSDRTKSGDCADSSTGQDACRLGIKVGGNWITQPTVREPIYSRQSQISGSFTFEGAKALADGLNLGAIDAPVSLSGELSIQPVLGESQFNKSLKAGALGLLLTMLYMIFFYRLSGVIASKALILYALLYILILKIWQPLTGTPIVLSLAGVAGIALSIGLAVDGNVLIFERMKEELRAGKSLKQSVEIGFNRAWSAIRDSNLTTLIVSLILYNFGSSLMKGFAVMLIIGTLLSIFTAVFVSRTMLRISTRFIKNKWLYGATPNNNKK